MLRGALGLHGLMDANHYGRLLSGHGAAEGHPTSIMADCDMLVFHTDFKEDYGSVPDALKTGLLTPERLDEAVNRIPALKAEVCFQEPCTEEIQAAA